MNPLQRIPRACWTVLSLFAIGFSFFCQAEAREDVDLLLAFTALSGKQARDDSGDCLLATNGRVASYQKISDLEGGFRGILEDSVEFGKSVAAIGDLDGDGVVDLVAGAQFDGDGGDSRGALWVLFMNTDGTVASYQKISDTEGGLAATFVNHDQFGRSVTSPGDIDGDGVQDLVAGAIGDDGLAWDTGAVQVMFMNRDGTVKAHQEISDTQGNLTGVLEQDDQFGMSVTSPGDLNGDGILDLVVGATGDDDGGDNRGALYVLFLDSDGTVATHQKISDTAGNFTATLDNDDWFGRSVRSPGDLNGDTVPDLVVGSRYDDDGSVNAGAVYILYMNTNGTVASHRKISDTTGGFTGNLTTWDQFSSVAAPGDLNLDGVPDLLVGALDDDDGGTNHGAVWTLFMNADGTVGSHAKISETDGNFHVTLDDYDSFGEDLDTPGDLNGDCVPDLVVSMFADDTGGTNRGSLYVLFLEAAK